MADPTQVKPPSAGVRPDLDPEDIPDEELTSAENMLQRDGNFMSRPGFDSLANSLNERPMSYFDYETESGAHLAMLATDRGWYVLGATAWADISEPIGRLTVTDPSNVTVFRTFAKAGVNWVLGTNGKDPMKKWNNGIGTYQNVGGNPPLADCMCVLADRVVLGHLNSGDTISPVAIDVSADKDFDSGYATILVALLADTPGNIVSMLEMGTLQGAVLKSDSLFMLIAQADTFAPFRIQWIKSGIFGPPTSALTFTLPDGTIGWFGTNGSGYLFDGGSVVEFPYKVQKFIVSTFNPDAFSHGWTAFDMQYRELWVIYPLAGSQECNGGAIINMATKDIFPIRFDMIRPTAGAKIHSVSGLRIGDLIMPIGQISRTLGELGMASLKKHFVIGDVTGQSMQDVGITDNGGPIPVFWESPVRGLAEKFSSVMRIRHRFYPSQFSQPINFQIGKRNEAGEISYGSSHTIDIGRKGRKATGHRTSAEFFSFKYSASLTQPIASYNGGAVYAKGRGQR